MAVKDLSDQKTGPKARSHPISIEHVAKSYGGDVVVDDLSFTVTPGRVTGFLGPNGAGKSTTMKILLGLASPTSGQPTIGGLAYGGLPTPPERWAPASSWMRSIWAKRAKPSPDSGGRHGHAIGTGRRGPRTGGTQCRSKPACWYLLARHEAASKTCRCTALRSTGARSR